MEKRGQAALEFMMTYGWTFLAAIIAIAAMAQVGITNSSKFISNICVLNPPLVCGDYLITSSGIQFVLKNGIGNNITASLVSVDGCGTDNTPKVIPDGKTYLQSIACTLNKGSKFKSNIKVNYVKNGSESIPLTSTGILSGEVQ